MIHPLAGSKVPADRPSSTSLQKTRTHLNQVPMAALLGRHAGGQRQVEGPPCEAAQDVVWRG